MANGKRIAEDGVTDLEKDLKNPYSYDAIDHMMQTIAKKHKITPKELHDRFVEKHGEIPDDWIKDKVDESWSEKYKRSINCSNPKGFSQRAHCAGRKKNEDLNEFAPDDSGDNGQEDLFFKYAKLWYNGNLEVQQRIEEVLDKAGWEIGEIESEEGGAFVVQSGDEHGDTYMGWSAEELQDLSENFHDGKKPGRKGLAKRVGVNCKQPVSKLRSIAKNSSGERQRMAHWCANMKSGKNESVSESIDVDNNLLDMLKKFLPVAQKELDLQEFPKMKPVLGLSSGEHPSFGRFVNELNAIEFAIENRHPIDILRTLAHELVHCKQREDQRLNPDSGETGSDEENEANARAGVIMRNFDDAYPEYFKEEPVSVTEGQDYVKNNVAYNDVLCPVAWTGDVLKEPVRLRLLQIAKVFVDYLDIPNFKIEDIVLTGSLANYNYTRYSDFDLHVVTKYSDLQCDDLAEAFYRAKKEIWNNQHDITIGGHEVELYVEDVNEPPVSAGMFSILNNEWIDTPEHNPPNIDSKSINAKVKDLVKQIDVAVETADDPGDIKRITDKLRKMRRAGLDTVGEFGVENLSYKVLRNMGYLDKLSKAYLNQQDNQLSL